MPKLRKKAPTVETIAHPKSRKAFKLQKEEIKRAARKKSKLVHQMKQTIIGSRAEFFRDLIPDDREVFTDAEIREFINVYLNRFKSELLDIRIKYSPGQKLNRQGAKREAVIELTEKREREEFETCGLEMPNLRDPHQVKILREWNGEPRFLQNFTFCRISSPQLESAISNANKQRQEENVEELS